MREQRRSDGRYVEVDVDRRRAARHGLNIADVQEIVRTAVGGVNVTRTVEGLERYPVNLRYPQRVRDSVERLKLLPVITPGGAEDVYEAVREGAGRRVRPIAMTAATLVAGLAPIMLGDGAGAEVMRRVAAPMFGGVVGVAVLALAVVPALFLLWHRRRVASAAAAN